MKKTVYALFLFSLVAVTLYAQEEKKSTASVPADEKNKPEFNFDQEEFQFGTVKQGEAVTHEFTFVNVGAEPLIITEAHGSCGCTVPQYPKTPIKNGEKGSIKVTFNTAGKQGMQDKTVTITSNAKTSPKVIHVKGTVLSKRNQK